MGGVDGLGRHPAAEKAAVAATHVGFGPKRLARAKDGARLDSQGLVTLVTGIEHAALLADQRVDGVAEHHGTTRIDTDDMPAARKQDADRRVFQNRPQFKQRRAARRPSH